MVFLDAGHGGRDPGALGVTSSGKKVAEKDAALEIVKVATAAFRAAGYRVVVSRWEDTNVRVLEAGDLNGDLMTSAGVNRDLLARVACANSAHADVLLSIHLNAFSDPDVGGTSMIYNAVRPFSAKNERLARLMQADVLESFDRAGFKVPDRKVMLDDANPGGALSEKGARYGHDIIIGPYAKGWVDNPSLMPGVVMEPLFLTKPGEADIATSAKGQQALADAMVAAVRRFLAG